MISFHELNYKEPHKLIWHHILIQNLLDNESIFFTYIAFNLSTFFIVKLLHPRLTHLKFPTNNATIIIKDTPCLLSYSPIRAYKGYLGWDTCPVSFSHSFAIVVMEYNKSILANDSLSWVCFLSNSRKPNAFPFTHPSPSQV